MCQSPYLYLLTSRCTHLDVDPVKVEPSLREILHLLPEELVRLELVMVMLSLRHCGRMVKLLKSGKDCAIRQDAGRSMSAGERKESKGRTGRADEAGQDPSKPRPGPAL